MTPPLGAHMSISGGMPLAVERARQVEATALQVFVKSSNQWAARPFAAGEVEAFRAASNTAGLTGRTIAHASYLINLASPDELLWERSVDAFAKELSRCAELGIPWLVVHPGSHVGSGVDAGIARVAEGVKQALDGRPGAGVLLEVTAGQGHTLGSNFEELARMLSAVGDPARAGVCLDTCHLFAAGYEFGDASAYEALTSALDAAFGLDRVRAIHLNDSKGKKGSRLDRHEHIGKGQIGLEGFRRFLNDRRFANIPMVLETPKGDDLAEDKMNLGVLRSLVAR